MRQQKAGLHQAGFLLFNRNVQQSKFLCDNEKPRTTPGSFVIAGRNLVPEFHAIAGVTPIRGTAAGVAGACLSSACVCERVRRWTK